LKVLTEPNLQIHAVHVKGISLGKKMEDLREALQNIQAQIQDLLVRL
jgi:hypothetical protein